MKLHHTVNHIPIEERADSIEFTGLIPQVADEYKDLVPEGIRHLPVVWLSETAKSLGELPVFEIDAEDLDQSRLYHTEIFFEADKDLCWWVYQGKIPAELISRLN